MISRILNHFKKLDWILILSSFSLVVMGLLSLYYQKDSSFFNKQIIFFAVGIVLMFLITFLDWRSIREDPYLILFLYFLSLVFLFLLFFLAPEIRGVKRWFKIGDYSIDPVEFAKLALIILLAKYFSTRHVEMYRMRHIILSGFYALIPFILIAVQPNLGSAAILIIAWFGILFFSGIKIRHFLIICLVLILILGIGWQFLIKDYHKNRVISFFSPHTTDPLGIGWNQTQSKIAIGSGGILGKGLGQGTQVQYGFLPEPHTDFIFSAIAEEMGLVGVMVLFILFGILLWRIMNIAILSRTNFPRLLALGFSVILVSQIFINIGMNLGILPVIGIPLPLVSYGGNNLIFIFIFIGILQSIKIINY